MEVNVFLLRTCFFMLLTYWKTVCYYRIADKYRSMIKSYWKKPFLLNQRPLIFGLNDWRKISGGKYLCCSQWSSCHLSFFFKKLQINDEQPRSISHVQCFFSTDVCMRFLSIAWISVKIWPPTSSRNRMLSKQTVLSNTY
jgi:hypothetical protein